jgi:hypothetical protein
MKHAISRRCDSDFPSRIDERCRHIAHNVANATDLAAWECAILGRKENYVLVTDGGRLSSV